MESSLCVLLPVENQQDSLESMVLDSLDLISELCADFSILIIDDGSTDDTIDVAHEMAVYYPQIEVIRHPIRMGIDEAIQTGLDHTKSDVVFVHAGPGLIDASQFKQMWKLREDQDLVVVQAEKTNKKPLMDRLMGWGAAISKEAKKRPDLPAGLQMIRRSGLKQWRIVESAHQSTKIMDNAQKNEDNYSSLSFEKMER